MNCLKYAYKFGVIGLLIVLQASVLIYMLVSELNKNIEFATQERAGVQYVRALSYLFDEGQAYRSIHYAYSIGDHSLEEELITQQAKVDAALEAVAMIDAQTASKMNTTWKLQMLRQDWLALKQNSLQFETRRAQVAFDLDGRWLNEVTDLMQHAGYAANLAMDSDFDTSYLVDSVLRKLPSMMEILWVSQVLSAQLSEENISPESRNHLLQAVGLLRSAMEQAAYNGQMVFRHNENIKEKLKSFDTALVDTVPIFAWNLEQKTVGQQGLPISQQLLISTGNQAIQNAMVLHKEELKVIDELLVLRIEKYLQYRNAVVIFTGSILLVVCYLFLGFDISVRKGVYQLDNVMACAGKGELSVRGEIYSRDEMGSLTYAINNTLDSLQNMYDEVQRSHYQLEVWNQQLELKVAERTTALRNLLDHAGQGFLTFGESLRICKEYSAECTAIFQRDIYGELVSALIYPVDRDQQVFLEAVFGKILQEKNDFLRETYFSLLPDEIVLDNSCIAIAYKMINNAIEPDQSNIMLILTDRTIQKTMEDQVQAERDILAMIVHVVTHSSDFFAAVSQYTSFCQDGMPSLLQDKKSAGEILATLFRTVHTFKGTFGQLHMGNIMAKLHGMEGRLDTIRAYEIERLEGWQLVEKLNAFTPETMLSWLDEDLGILKNKLGESFFQRENILVIDNSRLLEIEEKMQCVLPFRECNLLRADLRRLRYKPIKELLQSYPEYVCSLAERNEKAVHPFEIQGGEILVDPLQYYDFIKSLGHVFRNSIVHGLEAFEERLMNGKKEIGTISCSVAESDTGLTLVISDDGRGMDIADLRDKAVEKGICDPAVAKCMQESDWVQFIFADGFSGTKDVDELAGRGVGLSAVRAEVEKLGGSVNAHTTLGKGTEFQFFLPFPQMEENQIYSIRQLAKPLLNAVEDYLKNKADLSVSAFTYMEGGDGGKLKLRKASTFLGVKNIPAGKILLSADQEVVQYLVDKADGEEGSLDRKMENILSQYAQEIFRQAVKDLPNWGGTVTAEALVSILAEDASARYPQAETSTWVLDTDLGGITLSLIY
ncbi:MAG: ATP-binding protein [Negativicutes bacterium]